MGLSADANIALHNKKEAPMGQDHYQGEGIAETPIEAVAIPRDTFEELISNRIRHALRTFKYAPPRKCEGAAMRTWKDWLPKHMLTRWNPQACCPGRFFRF